MPEINVPNEVVQAARVAANTMRKDTIQEFSDGETDLFTIVEKSKSKKYKPLAAIRILDLFQAAGWDKNAAREAMIENNFGVKDTILNVRRVGSRVKLLSTLMGADDRNWRARPTMPYNWPWQGKFDVLTEEMSRREKLALAKDFGLDYFVQVTEENSKIGVKGQADVVEPQDVKDDDDLFVDSTYDDDDDDLFGDF